MNEKVMLKLYLETSVVSYLTARPSRDLVLAAHQQLTREWWDFKRRDFQMFVSQLVIQEAGAGDSKAAQRRLLALENIPLLDLTSEVLTLARAVIDDGILPIRAKEDALHLAVATVHKMDFLLTWNCRHIANPDILRRITLWHPGSAYQLPVICTPAEFFGD
jgi:predicted nucleic acid-binding protein